MAMNRRLWLDVGLGAAAFAAAHLVERTFWAAAFEPAAVHPPWFLNSARAVAFAAAWFFAIGIIVARARRADGLAGAAAAAAGAIAAMVAILVAIGPGTIFPIAIAVGIGVVAASLLAGWFVGGLY